jgi:subtilisin family serine protease
MKEFPATKRSPFSKSFAYANGPWVDHVGHGSMCACIAAATKSAGGRYDGVAPDATILSARSTLAATDIYKLYDWVLSNKRSGALQGPVVMSNSYGLYTCSPPGVLPEDHPYRGIILDAVAAGIVVVFAAGNNHADELCDNDPKLCSPNTIWTVNSLDEVLSVGTVNWNNTMDAGRHANSSRGPGQWAQNHPKPDCVAPTYGEVIWGSSYQHMQWWGTSGACPQVAGLAALLLSAEPDLKPAEVADLIRKACDPIGLEPSCAGAGRINCGNAVAALKARKKRRAAGAGRRKGGKKP